jgi:hypothetical protein
MTVDFGVVRNSSDNELYINSFHQALMGIITAYVFIDKNHNKIFDQDDIPLENAKVTLMQRRDNYRTDRSGKTVIQRLEANRPVDLRVDETSLGNIFYRPTVAGVRVYPRAGKTIEVFLPIEIFSDIEGMVFSDMTLTEGMNRIPIILTRNNDQNIIAKVKSDTDGVYILEGIPAGDYTITVDPVYLQKNQITVSPEKIELKVAGEGDFISNKNFYFIKR